VRGVLVVGGGKTTLDVFFSAKKAQNERWEVVPGHKTMEQIPGGLSQQTMMGPKKGLNVTTDVQN
jgi:hypothetical protein